jgi:protoporphyrinogen oxidase
MDRLRRRLGRLRRPRSQHELSTEHGGGGAGEGSLAPLASPAAAEQSLGGGRVSAGNFVGCVGSGVAMTTVIIGAGPAGLACAARLVDLGQRPVVVEASPHVGGMARSVELWGHTVDLGPHRFFSGDPVVVAFWHRHVAGDHVMVSRQTRILYDQRFYDYPLKVGNALQNLGVVRAVRAVVSFLVARVRPPKDDGSLESWVSARFGVVLFRTFFKTYTEKLWGVSCTELDGEWAAQRIQGLTLWGAIRSALVGNRGNSLKTLVDEFAYPRSGNSLFYDRMRSHVESNGGSVRLEAPVRRVLVEAGRAHAVVLADGTEVAADHVVSSMPITLLLKGLPDVPDHVQAAADRLRFRNTILVYLNVRSTDLFPDQWLYVHDTTVRHGRITNFRNWSPEIVGPDATSVLCLEFWCFDEDDIWGWDEERLVALAREELGRTGLADPALVEAGAVIRVPRCYPVYSMGYREHLEVVTSYLDGIQGLTAIGRYGAFKYNNQDHSLLMGILAAEAVAAGEIPDLWHVNTDSTYQEAAPTAVMREPGPGVTADRPPSAV